jgi:predicted amidohydrolase
MKIWALELPHRFGDPAAQLRALDEALAPVERGDVVLLPELALTGYVSPSGSFDLARFAEAADGALAMALAKRASDHGAWIFGAIVERAGDRLYNTMIGHAPSGAPILRYRKRHPWFPETWATPGDAPHPRFDLSALTASAAICFDVHFLAEEAKEALAAADLLLFSSAWVEDEGDQRFQLLPELARTFSLWIVNANWGPGEPSVRTQGKSLIVAPDGRIVRVAGPGERAISVDITVNDD